MRQQRYLRGGRIVYGIPYPKFLSKEWFKMYFNLGKEELKMLQRNKDNPAQSPKAKELMRERIDQLNRRQ